jgi:uncharacterized membrane protein
MADEYEFMLPEDRAQKIAEFASKRQAWVSTRSRGKARFVLFSGALREAVVIIGLNVLYGFFLHTSIAIAVEVSIFTLLMGRVFNLLEWHWNERRFRRLSRA